METISSVITFTNLPRCCTVIVLWTAEYAIIPFGKSLFAISTRFCLKSISYFIRLLQKEKKSKYTRVKFVYDIDRTRQIQKQNIVKRLSFSTDREQGARGGGSFRFEKLTTWRRHTSVNRL